MQIYLHLGMGFSVRGRDGTWKPASFIAHVWSILWRKDAGRKIRGKGTGGYGGLAETAARTRQEGEDGGGIRGDGSIRGRRKHRRTEGAWEGT